MKSKYSHFRPELMLASRLLSLATRAFLSGLFRSKYIDSAQAYWVALEKKINKERRQGKSSELAQLNICSKHTLTSYSWNLTTYLNIRSLPWLWLVNLTKSSMSRAEQVVPVGFKSDKWSLTLISGWHKVAHWWNTPRWAIWRRW